MRLFIAINFPEKTKDLLCRNMAVLRAMAKQGRYTHRDNLHLTLVFLGEVEANRLEDIRRVMDSVTVPSFELTIGHGGRFRRDGGDIYWQSVSGSSRLTELYGQLYDGLKAAGFKLESRSYKPHLTLGRQVVISGDPKLETDTVLADRISLMLSQRIEGKLKYTELYGKRL